MARAASNRGGGLIDLTFDSDEESEEYATPINARADDFNDLVELEEGDPATPIRDSSDDFNDLVELEEGGPATPIDLTGLADISDVEIPPSPVRALSEEVRPITEVECLQNILNVFPDIAVDFVTDLIQKEESRTTIDCERLITKLLDDGAYPKERDEANQRKRKRGANDEPDFAEFETGQQGVGVAGYRQNS